MKIPILETKNYVIRPYRKSDAEVATKNLQNRKITKWLSSVPEPYHLRDAKSWIAATIKEHRKKQPGSITWVIEKEGQMIGAIGVSSITPGHKASVGYWIAEENWGQGVVTEVLKKVSTFVFQEFKLVRLEARVFKGNKGSARVLEKNGFLHEGLVRKGEKKYNRVIDYDLFAKIK